MSKRTVVAAVSVVAAAVALGTTLAYLAQKAAHQPGVREPLPLAMVCDSEIVVDESCSYDMPKTLGGPTTSHCSFTIDCCGAAVQTWKKDFPEPDGRGRFGHFQDTLTYSCKVSPNDVDRDGIANYDDEFPTKPQSTTVAVAPGAPAKPAESPTPAPTPAAEPEPETEFEIGSVNR